MSITSQQGPYARFRCGRGFQEEINHIQIFKELLSHGYDLLIQLLLYLVDKLVVIRAILNIIGFSYRIYCDNDNFNFLIIAPKILSKILTILIGIS